jgi:hypothetical protein
MIEDLIRIELDPATAVSTLQVLQAVEASCARSIEELKESNAAAIASFDAAVAKRGEILEQYRQMNAESRRGSGRGQSHGE